MNAPTKFSESASRIQGVEIFADGPHRGKNYTPQDLQDIADNFHRYSAPDARKVYLNVPVVKGHDEDQEYLQRTDIPADGWVTNVYVQGGGLFADFDHVPPKTATLLKQKRYGPVSAEIYDEPPEGIPGAAGKMLRRVALLGGDIPEVKGLKGMPDPQPYSEGAIASRRRGRLTYAGRVKLPGGVWACFSEVRVAKPVRRMAEGDMPRRRGKRAEVGDQVTVDAPPDDPLSHLNGPATVEQSIEGYPPYVRGRQGSGYRQPKHLRDDQNQPHDHAESDEPDLRARGRQRRAQDEDKARRAEAGKREREGEQEGAGYSPGERVHVSSRTNNKGKTINGQHQMPHGDNYTVAHNQGGLDHQPGHVWVRHRRGGDYSVPDDLLSYDDVEDHAESDEDIRRRTIEDRLRQADEERASGYAEEPEGQPVDEALRHRRWQERRVPQRARGEAPRQATGAETRGIGPEDPREYESWLRGEHPPGTYYAEDDPDIDLDDIEDDSHEDDRPLQEGDRVAFQNFRGGIAHPTRDRNKQRANRGSVRLADDAHVAIDPDNGGGLRWRHQGQVFRDMGEGYEDPIDRDHASVQADEEDAHIDDRPLTMGDRVIYPVGNNKQNSRRGTLTDHGYEGDVDRRVTRSDVSGGRIDHPDRDKIHRDMDEASYGAEDEYGYPPDQRQSGNKQRPRQHAETYKREGEANDADDAQGHEDAMRIIPRFVSRATARQEIEKRSADSAANRRQFQHKKPPRKYAEGIDDDAGQGGEIPEEDQQAMRKAMLERLGDLGFDDSMVTDETPAAVLAEFVRVLESKEAEAQTPGEEQGEPVAEEQEGPEQADAQEQQQEQQAGDDPTLPWAEPMEDDGSPPEREFAEGDDTPGHGDRVVIGEEGKSRAGRNAWIDGTIDEPDEQELHRHQQPGPDSARIVRRDDGGTGAYRGRQVRRKHAEDEEEVDGGQDVGLQPGDRVRYGQNQWTGKGGRRGTITDYGYEGDTDRRVDREGGSGIVDYPMRNRIARDDEYAEDAPMEGEWDDHGDPLDEDRRRREEEERERSGEEDMAEPYKRGRDRTYNDANHNIENERAGGERSDAGKLWDDLTANSHELEHRDERPRRRRVEEEEFGEDEDYASDLTRNEPQTDEEFRRRWEGRRGGPQSRNKEERPREEDMAEDDQPQDDAHQEWEQRRHERPSRKESDDFRKHEGLPTGEEDFDLFDDGENDGPDHEPGREVAWSSARQEEGKAGRSNRRMHATVHHDQEGVRPGHVRLVDQDGVFQAHPRDIFAEDEGSMGEYAEDDEEAAQDHRPNRFQPGDRVRVGGDPKTGKGSWSGTMTHHGSDRPTHAIVHQSGTNRLLHVPRSSISANDAEGYAEDDESAGPYKRDDEADAAEQREMERRNYLPMSRRDQEKHSADQVSQDMHFQHKRPRDDYAEDDERCNGDPECDYDRDDMEDGDQGRERNRRQEQEDDWGEPREEEEYAEDDDFDIGREPHVHESAPSEEESDAMRHDLDSIETPRENTQRRWDARRQAGHRREFNRVSEDTDRADAGLPPRTPVWQEQTIAPGRFDETRRMSRQSNEGNRSMNRPMKLSELKNIVGQAAREAAREVVTSAMRGESDRAVKSAKGAAAELHKYSEEVRLAEKKRSVAAVVERLSAEGKLPPAIKDSVERRLMRTDARTVYKFTEGGKTVSRTPFDDAVAELEAMPTLFAERFASPSPAAGSEDAEVAKVEAHYSAFSESFGKLGTSKEDMVKAYKARRSGDKQLTADQFLGK